MTAQEAFEREGYIVLLSFHDHEPGKVVRNENEMSLIPLGTLLVLTERITKEQALAFQQRCGWDSERLHCPGIKYYKAVAE